MKAKLSSPKGRARDPLVGTWTSSDEYLTEVEFLVEHTAEGYSVRAIDRYDDEEADIFETAWDGSVLSFAVHWNSTGRFTRYRIQLLSANRVHVIYTYTEAMTYRRKPKTRAA